MKEEILKVIDTTLGSSDLPSVVTIDFERMVITVTWHYETIANEYLVDLLPDNNIYTAISAAVIELNN